MSDFRTQLSQALLGDADEEFENEPAYPRFHWGTVQEDSRVQLDRDQSPLPQKVNSLDPVYPGQRVLVSEQGKSLTIHGANVSSSYLEMGESADSKNYAQTLIVEDGGFATSEYGLPNVGEAGWLEVSGSPGFAYQRYVTQASRREFVRSQSSGGLWSAWQEIAVSRGPVTLTPLAPWGRYAVGSSYGPLQYAVSGNQVTLSGMVDGGRGGVSEPVVILPSEVRPTYSQIVTFVVENVPLSGQISASGEVYLRVAQTEAVTWMSVSCNYTL